MLTAITVAMSELLTYILIWQLGEYSNNSAACSLSYHPSAIAIQHQMGHSICCACVRSYQSDIYVFLINPFQMWMNELHSTPNGNTIFSLSNHLMVIS